MGFDLKSDEEEEKRQDVRNAFTDLMEQNEQRETLRSIMESTRIAEKEQQRITLKKTIRDLEKEMKRLLKNVTNKPDLSARIDELEKEIETAKNDKLFHG